MESISDWLTTQGFAPNYTRDCFEKTGVFGYIIEIPFSSLAGHTIQSFQKFAEQKGWLTQKQEDDAGYAYGYVGLYCGLSEGIINPDGTGVIEPFDDPGYKRTPIKKEDMMDYIKFPCLTFERKIWGWFITEQNDKILCYHNLPKPYILIPSIQLNVRFAID